MIGQQPIEFVRRHVEERIGHAEGIEQAFLQESVEGHAAQALDNEPSDVHGHAVVPALAGFEHQRQCSQAFGELVQILAGEWLDFGVLRVHGIPARVEAVGQAGGVGKQMTHRHRLLRRHQFAVDEHVEVGEFGNELRHRIRQRELAFLVEHHRRDGGDGLAHGVDAEQGVLGHGPVVVRATLAHRLEVHDLAVPGDEGDHARELALVHVALGRLGDAIQAFGGHAGVGWGGSDNARCRRRFDCLGRGDLDVRNLDATRQSAYQYRCEYGHALFHLSPQIPSMQARESSSLSDFAAVLA